MAEQVDYMEDMRGACRASVRRFERKRSLGNPRHRREDNSEKNLQVVGWGCMEWIELAQATDRWWDIFLKVRGISRLAEDQVTS